MDNKIPRRQSPIVCVFGYARLLEEKYEMITRIKDLFWGIYPNTLKGWAKEFYRSDNPEKEILEWLQMVGVYDRIAKDHPEIADKRGDVAEVLLANVAGYLNAADVREFAESNRYGLTLTNEQIELIIDRWCSRRGDNGG